MHSRKIQCTTGIPVIASLFSNPIAQRGTRKEKPILPDFHVFSQYSVFLSRQSFDIKSISADIIFHKAASVLSERL